MRSDGKVKFSEIKWRGVLSDVKLRVGGRMRNVLFWVGKKWWILECDGFKSRFGRQVKTIRKGFKVLLIRCQLQCEKFTSIEHGWWN